MWQFISLAVIACAPFELSRRLKTELKKRRGQAAHDVAPLPEPRAWTTQRDESPYFSWRALDVDMWADQREELSRDVWAKQRIEIDSDRERDMPASIPHRREYIMNKYDGGYSYGAPLAKQ